MNNPSGIKLALLRLSWQMFKLLHRTLTTLHSSQPSGTFKMPRKASFLFFCLCIPLAIASPFSYHGTDSRPGPTSVLITSAPSLPLADLQNRNTVASLLQSCDEKPCVAIKIIHGVTTTSPCKGQIGCITYAKVGLREVPPMFVKAVKSTTTRVPIKESTSSENTFTWLDSDEATTFYVYVTEEIKPTSSRSVLSATTLGPTSTAPRASASLVSSILLPVNSPYTTGVAKTSSTQSYYIPSEILQSSAHTGVASVSPKPTSAETISTTSSHFQPLTTRLSPPKPTFKISNALTSASTILRSVLPPTYGLTSIIHEVSAMPMATHPPTLLMGMDRISSVITDISLLMSILTATEALTPSLVGSRQIPNVKSSTLPTPTPSPPPAITHSSSTAPTPLPALGIAGISSVITDIALLESILAATLTATPTFASIQTTTKASMPPSSHTLTSLNGKKSITSTRTITRTASPLTVAGGPKWVDKPLWGTGKAAVECACQCKGQRFNLTATKPV